MAVSLHLEGMAGPGPDASGGVELLAAVSGIVAATEQEPIQGVVSPHSWQTGQLAGGVGGGDKYLH